MKSDEMVHEQLDQIIADFVGGGFELVVTGDRFVAVRLVTSSAVEMLGFADGDLTKPVDVKSLESHVHPADRDRMRRSIDSLLEQPITNSVAWRWKEPELDGQYRWLKADIRSRHVENRVVMRGVLRDGRQTGRRERVTDEMGGGDPGEDVGGPCSSDGGLRADSSSPGAILEPLNSLTLAIDPERRVVGMLGTRIARQLGLGDQECIGRRLSDTELAGPIIRQVLKAIEQVEEGGDICEMDCSLELSGRRRGSYQVTVAPGDRQPLLDAGFIVEVQDITERRRAEESLRRQKRRAEAEADARVEAMAQLSHEIRTPISGVQGIAGLLAETQLTEEQRRYVDTIEACTSKLLTQTRDPLIQFEIGSQPREPIMEPFDLASVCQELIELLSPTADKQGLDLNLDYAHKMPQQFIGARQLIRQVLLNLLGNALKYTETGEITLRVESCESETSKYGVRIEVEDTGVGIREADIEQIFTPHSRTSIAEQIGEGSGLGLAICRRFVERMGGSLDVESQPGVGSVFGINLELSVHDFTSGSHEDSPCLNCTRRAMSCPEVQHESLSWGRSFDVLLVTDERVNHLVARELLEGIGCEVETATTTDDAIRQFRESSFDIVFMDCKLYDGTGTEAAESMRRIECGELSERSSTPIVALSAGPTNLVASDVFESGMNDFITKPTSAEDLMQAIERWCVLPDEQTCVLPCQNSVPSILDLDGPIGREGCTDTKDTETLFTGLAEGIVEAIPSIWDAFIDSDRERLFAILNELEEAASVALGTVDC